MDGLEHKPIKGNYKFDYSVTEDGKVWVRHPWDKDWRELSCCRAGKDRTTILVRLHEADDKKGYHSVARLVWETFRGPVPDGYVVAKKSGSLLDASIYNIEIVPKNSDRRHTSRRKPVEMIGEDGETIALYSSCADAAAANYLSAGGLCYRMRKSAEHQIKKHGVAFVRIKD